MNVVGRFLLASVFVGAGAAKYLALQPKTSNPEFVLASVKPIVESLGIVNGAAGTSFAIPEQYYKQVVTLMAVVEGLGGFLLVQNHKFGAILLVLLSLPLTIMTYRFWEDPSDSPTHQNNLLHFLKNIAIIGGLISFIATTDGVPLRTSRRDRLEEGERMSIAGGR